MATPTILLVDSNAVMRRLLTLSLINQGFRVTSIAIGEEATALLREENFDVVITDIDLPGMQGRQLLHIIKTSQRDLKVIVMSAQRTQKEYWQLYGALEALIKPFDNKEFILKLNMVLKERRKTIRFKSKDVFCKIRNQTTREERSGILNNISFDGALIDAPAGFKEKDVLEIVFTDPSSDAVIGTVHGTIIRIEEKKDELQVQIGVYFEEGKQLEFLEQLVPTINASY